MRILQDDKKTHQTFEAILNNEERINKRGPHVKGFLKKCKDRSQARYKRRNGILKSIRDLKIVAGDDTVVGFLKHPIDGGTEKLVLYSTLEDLVLNSKVCHWGLKLQQLWLVMRIPAIKKRSAILNYHWQLQVNAIEFLPIS